MGRHADEDRESAAILFSRNKSLIGTQVRFAHQRNDGPIYVVESVDPNTGMISISELPGWFSSSLFVHVPQQSESINRDPQYVLLTRAEWLQFEDLPLSPKFLEILETRNPHLKAEGS